MPDLKQTLLPVVSQAAQTYGVPEAILINLITQESGWSEDVAYGRRVSSAGAQGIAQFMPATAREVASKIGQFDPLNPYEAIPAAAWYLKSQIDYFDGDIEKGVAAYNAGAGNVEAAVKKAFGTKGSTLGDITFGAIGNRTGFTQGNWREHVPSETKTYLANVYGAGPDAPSPSTFSAAYGSPATATGRGPATVPMGNGGISPPNLTKFIGEYGEVDGYQMYLESFKAYQTMRYQEAADISTYLDVVTNEISQEIAMGKLNLATANAEYGRRMEALTTGNQMYQDMMKYAIPPSAVNGYLPGGEPGGIYDQMGMTPRIIPGSDVSTINPFQMANDVLAQSPPIPQPNIDTSRLQGGAEQVKAALEKARGEANPSPFANWPADVYTTTGPG